MTGLMISSHPDKLFHSSRLIKFFYCLIFQPLSLTHSVLYVSDSSAVDLDQTAEMYLVMSNDMKRYSLRETYTKHTSRINASVSVVNY